MTERKPISKKTRFEILKRDRFTCRYCGAKAPDVLLHIEHVVPVSKGGSNDYENLIAACEGCNLGKGARLLSDDAAIVKSRDLLETSQAEIDQLEQLVKWRKNIAKKKAAQKEFVIASLQEISDTEFTDYGAENVLQAYDKFGFEDCSEYITTYLVDCDNRVKNKNKPWRFSKYIEIQKTKDQPESRKKYLSGIARNKIGNDPTLWDFIKWLKNFDSPNVVEIMIDDLKKHVSITPDDFFEWWHEIIRTTLDSDCCDYHKHIWARGL